ncbi:hypothetical protein CC2G_013309 [Coprinopsis cinerea AmutBmut pab1-1]|nr:hypothetical protein CC2G_013309 [Coprinopsis cinerea AmutBmut pab1-1]
MSYSFAPSELEAVVESLVPDAKIWTAGNGGLDGSDDGTPGPAHALHWVSNRTQGADTLASESTSVTPHHLPVRFTGNGRANPQSARFTDEAARERGGDPWASAWPTRVFWISTSEYDGEQQPQLRLTEGQHPFSNPARLTTCRCPGSRRIHFLNLSTALDRLGMLGENLVEKVCWSLVRYWALLGPNTHLPSVAADLRTTRALRRRQLLMNVLKPDDMERIRSVGSRSTDQVRILISIDKASEIVAPFAYKFMKTVGQVAS